MRTRTARVLCLGVALAPGFEKSGELIVEQRPPIELS
jgi:hypothetical protein